MVHPDNGIFFSAKNKCGFSATKRQGGNLNAYYQVKEDNLRRLCTILFQVYDILEKAKMMQTVKDQWLPGSEGGKER